MLKTTLIAATLAAGALALPSIASAAPLGAGSAPAASAVQQPVETVAWRWIDGRRVWVDHRGPRRWERGPARCRVVTTVRVNRFGERVRSTRRICR